MGFDARGTDGEPFGLSVHLCPHILKIGKPATTRPVVSVADVVPAHGSLPADVTNLCHNRSLKFSTDQYTQKHLWTQTAFLKIIPPLRTIKQ
jgi:hypothetical protein